MSQNSKGLGRGLNVLFNQVHNEVPEIPPDSPFVYLSPDILLPNPTQPRNRFAEEGIDELAASIRAQGILQPLLVRPAAEEGRFQIIAGERRWRAAKRAGLASVPVMVRNLDDQQAMVAALIENVQREDLNPIEEARALLQIKEALNITQEELADAIGQTRSIVSNSLRLLRLSQAAQDDLINGLITAGHARCILAVGNEEKADELRARIADKGMSVREAEQAVNFWRTENRFPWDRPEGNGDQTTGGNPEIARLAKEIGATLNCRTKISGSIDKGRISLAYESNEQLFELLAKLGLSLSA